MNISKSTKKIRYTSARYLRKIANRIAPKNTVSGVSFGDIGAGQLPKNAPRALVIYNTAGVERYVQGKFNEHDPFFNKHTMYWESVEMVRLLNEAGYVVDYADCRYPVSVDWPRYAVIIDQWDNLKSVPPLAGQILVSYATYIHWLNWNRAELERISWFKERTGIVIPMNRQLPTILSDESADYLTYFGTQTQADSFNPKPVKHQLNISAVYVPEYRPKNIAEARKNFLWLGGGGLVHKGLDIAMESFARMPDMHLQIAGNLRDEPRFWQWAEPFLAKHPNIHSHGWMDVASQEFDAIARKCIGIVYPSAAEGGPGSVAQVLHWGLIPIVTKSALVRAETLGSIIDGVTDRELIESAVRNVQALVQRAEADLRVASDAVAEFARSHHTRQAYSESFRSLLDTIASR